MLKIFDVGDTYVLGKQININAVYISDVKLLENMYKMLYFNWHFSSLNDISGNNFENVICAT